MTVQAEVRRLKKKYGKIKLTILETVGYLKKDEDVYRTYSESKHRKFHISYVDDSVYPVRAVIEIWSHSDHWRNKGK